jgi:hypothetical protein
VADDLILTVDLQPILDNYKGMMEKARSQLEKAVQHLAAQTHAHVKEQAQGKLHSTRDIFLENLDFEQIDKRTWAVTVREKGLWIEEGMPPHSMLEDLLASPKAKTAKDGSKYLVVPFKHNKGPTQTTPHQQEMVSSIKEVLREKKIPYGKIERNPDGSPKSGLLHKMDLHGPKQNRAPNGAEGPPGKPFSTHAPGAGEEGPSGRPYLWGMRIYQRLLKNPDGSPKMGKDGHPKASREIFTFRVASSKQAAMNKWFHPGLEPKGFLDEAYTWAQDQWDNYIAPEILRSLDKG